MRKKPLKILNPDLKEDYHIHSSNYSDGRNTINEIIVCAKELGLKKIMFADHSDMIRRSRSSWSETLSFENKINDLDVSFAVEADILNEKGDIADSISGIKADKIILSLHIHHYDDDYSTITDGMINAMKRNKDRIFCLAHIHMGSAPWATMPEFDTKKVIETANKYNIPVEINAHYMLGKMCNYEVLDLIWELADTVVLNTDSHSIENMKTRHEKLKEFLQEKGYFK